MVGLPLPAFGSMLADAAPVPWYLSASVACVPALLLVPLVFAACAGAAEPPTSPTIVPDPTDAAATAIPLATSQQPPGGLVLWVTPRFVPDPNSRAGDLLRARLEAFEASHPGLQVSVRVKSPHGVFDSLASATDIAPSTIPALAILDSASLAAAADMLETLDERITLDGDTDWYGFALANSRAGDRIIGLPFAAEAELFAYDAQVFDSPPITWGALLTDQGSFVIPAADPHSLFLVAQYLALGGQFDLVSEIDAMLLSEALAYLRSAHESGALSPLSLESSSSSETWQLLLDGQATAAQAPLSEFVESYNPTMYAAGPLPTSDGRGVSLAETWYWVMVPGSDDDLTQELLGWLTDTGFLAEWTHALGLLPAQPEVLALWPDSPETAIVSRVVSVALPRPDAETMEALGPRFSTALREVLNGQLTPNEAAALAASAP